MRRGNINNKSEQVDKNIQEQVQIPDVMNTVETVDKKEPDKANESTKKEVNKDKIKVIILIIGIVLSVLVTSGLLIYKYVKSNEQDVNNDVNTGITNNKTEEKKETEDKKYLVSFKDMYTINPLIITTKEYEKEATKKQGNIDIEYVEIAGLQDKQLQERINKEIKDNAFYHSDKVTAKQQHYSYTTVRGNFSNILSIDTDIYVYEKDDIVFEESLTLNYNLATGEQIKFLDLFASNTPMNSIIYDLEYERLAWDTEYSFDMSDKEIDKATNMDKRDTSEYEDIILKVINRYKNLDKDKIVFCVTPNSIYVSLGVGEGGEEVHYTIDLYKYIDYITMYKKFLTDKVVFESEVSNKLLVFNDMMGYKPKYYKFELDNLFISVFSLEDDEYSKEEERDLVEKYSQSTVNKKNELMQEHMDEIISDVKAIAKKNKNKGYVARFMPYSNIDEYKNEYGGEILIYVSMDGAFEEMNIAYYNENALKLIAKQNTAPKVSIDSVFVGNIGNDNKNIKSLLYNEDEENVLDLTAYYTLDGKKIATTYEEAKEYINNKYVEPEPEVEPESEPEPEPDPEINIYKED